MPVFFRLLLAKMHARKGRSQKYSPTFQRMLILRYLADCRTEGGENVALDSFLRLVVRPFATTAAPTVAAGDGQRVDADALLREFDLGDDMHSCVPLGRQVGELGGDENEWQ